MVFFRRPWSLIPKLLRLLEQWCPSSRENSGMNFKQRRTQRPRLAMSNLGQPSIRSRNSRNSKDAPPVPPKGHPALTTATAIPAAIFQQQPKPLPPTPYGGIPSALDQTSNLNSGWKPLPRPPVSSSSVVKNTLLWIAGFCVWFLLVVVALPIILEQDAMPGLNRWLRTVWSSEER